MPRVLSDDQVMGILTDHERGMSAVGIAAKYGISRMNVNHIVTGRTHRDVAARWEEDRGVTEAELEAIIAEQLPTMPKESRYTAQDDFMPHAVTRGRGMFATGRARKAE